MFEDVVCPSPAPVPQGRQGAAGGAARSQAHIPSAGGLLSAAGGGGRSRGGGRAGGQNNLSSNQDSVDALIDKVINLLREIKVKVHFGSSSSISNNFNGQHHDAQGNLVQQGDSVFDGDGPIFQAFDGPFAPEHTNGGVHTVQSQQSHHSQTTTHNRPQTGRRNGPRS